MKVRIVRIEKGKEGIILPDDYLRQLELLPGSEVELRLDKKRKWIIIRAVHGEDFVEHFKETMDTMA
ncbi:MAG: hypothetical protein HZB21_02640 [Deltaproteobacteria bacterium]|nr:hypothetical protein [Deltaproteobacteria bacterium]